MRLAVDAEGAPLHEHLNGKDDHQNRVDLVQDLPEIACFVAGRSVQRDDDGGEQDADEDEVLEPVSLDDFGQEDTEGVRRAHDAEGLGWGSDRGLVLGSSIEGYMSCRRVI